MYIQVVNHILQYWYASPRSHNPGPDLESLAILMNSCTGKRTTSWNEDYILGLLLTRGVTFIIFRFSRIEERVVRIRGLATCYQAESIHSKASAFIS